MSDRIANNRRQRKWTIRELIGRVVWSLISPAFRLSPRPFWAWRRFLLRAFGARIGRHVHIDPSVTIFIPWNLDIDDWSSIGFDALLYNLGPLKIGKRVTISQRVHLCGGTHDYRDPTMPLIKSPITISDDCWICADAFVGPGITVSVGAIVAARGVVVRDVEAMKIVGGHPASVIKQRDGNLPA
jgi:putative colanic acid biosynthesis acetyltransferase WcaF